MNPALLIVLAVLGLAACADQSQRSRPGAAPRQDGGARAGATTPTGGGATGIAPAAGSGAAGIDVAPGPGASPADDASLDASSPGAAAPGGVRLRADLPLPVRRFVGAALQMLGQPYRHGGSAPGGFDCSGLVAYAGRQVGLRFPRTAREQQRSGVPITPGALEPGDLVFMRLRGRQHHVGIMIDASHFVHAPSTGGRVRVDSLDVKPYRNRILAVRRPDFTP